MIATPDIDQIIGAEAVDPNNDRIGKVSQIYVDADTDQPTWASVRTGLFGLSESLVPLDNATWDQEQLHVLVEKAQVKDAPRVDPDAEISPEEQERLYRYYGLSGSAGADTGQSDTTVAGQADLDGSGLDMAGMQDLSGSDADLRTDVAMPVPEAEPAGGGAARSDTDADRAHSDDAATMSDTGYGAGAGLAGAGVGRAPRPDDVGPDPRAMQGDPAMQTESGATGMPLGTQEVGAGMQRQPGGGMRLRRYAVRQETVAAPMDQQDELRMQPGAASSMDDASTGMRTDDQDPREPGHR